jgi:hypothetical protein
MKNVRILNRLVSLMAVLALVAIWPLVSQATPYASCITNGNNTVGFYLNEGGGNVTVTYEDSTIAPGFNNATLASGAYNFPLGPTHTSYTISVAKVGAGAATVINTKGYGTPRGIDVNKNPSSPYFGNVYCAAASTADPTKALFRLNSDLSGISTNGGGVAWNNSASSPYRLAVNDDDYLTVGSFSSAISAVWRIDPTLSNNQLLLGPIGQTAGYAAMSQGDQFSRPLLIGNLQTGGTATLFTVDAGSIPNVNASQLNSVLVYSNITLATLPRETEPDLLGPEVCLNLVLNNNYPGITVGPANQTPTRYIYCSNRRDGPSNAGVPTVQIYALTNLLANTAGGGASGAVGPGVNFTDPTTVGCVWDSYYNSGVNDYFNQNGTGPADSAVSPDGKYFATIGYGNNEIRVVSLTNGIPDVSTLYVIANTVSTTSAGRGLCWDAADNVYLSSSGGATFQEWTLGFTATAVTTGNASGPTGFSLVLPSTTVGVVASNSISNTIISQQNSYGNPTNATFVITRTGNVSSPLSVAFSLGGTASNTTYTANHTTGVIIASGQSSTNITITAITDGIARPTTAITLTLAPASGYALAPAFATLTYLNTAPDELVASVGAPTMYNVFSNDYASLIITRWGDTNAATLTASSFTYSGTAVEGVDYTQPTPVTFNPGDLTQTSYIYPLHNGQLPVDSSANPYVGNKTAIIGIGSGLGYSPATNTALLNILDSANPTTTVLWADPLTDPNDATNWGVTAANNNMQTNAIDTAIAGTSESSVIFGYDLQNGDPGDFGAVPLPPSGAATALRVTVNKSEGAAAGVNLYPTNHTFSGNYAVRFNMNIVQGDNNQVSTEGPLVGINHNGRETNWWSASALLSGWGPSPGTENWESDGVWYWLNADNDNGGGTYLEYTGLGGALPNTGWQEPAAGFAPTYANAFKTNVFTGGVYWGPGLVSSASILNGLINGLNPAINWADVEIKQINNIVTLSIDKTPVFVYTNATAFTNGTLMLGYDDPFSSIGAPDAAVYFSNLRVVSLASPIITQIAVNKVNNTVVINFTTDDGDLIASSFALQSAAAVNGPYADNAGASITALSAGAFQAVVPLSGSVQFYRVHIE